MARSTRTCARILGIMLVAASLMACTEAARARDRRGKGSGIRAVPGKRGVQEEVRADAGDGERVKVLRPTRSLLCSGKSAIGVGHLGQDRNAGCGRRCTLWRAAS
jgi:hypothetical protein